ncbi:homing endonuclease associated repeat-containing protein [Oxobacter pfennigii]|uniref:homing endonuclease associated repeat-containing protein n=1 Tax=Oxobacter pfennigii TaxID=36849 RepID=UPI0006D406B1|nr:hypothetical protein [Oxobacter pfennigii]
MYKKKISFFISGGGTKGLDSVKYLKENYEECITQYRRETDEQLYQRVRDLATKLGRLPIKSEIPAFDYLKYRLGNWPRIMENAGLKPVSEKRRRMLEQRVQKKKEKCCRKNKNTLIKGSASDD